MRQRLASATTRSGRILPSRVEMKLTIAAVVPDAGEDVPDASVPPGRPTKAPATVAAPADEHAAAAAAPRDVSRRKSLRVMPDVAWCSGVEKEELIERLRSCVGSSAFINSSNPRSSYSAPMNG